MTVIVAVIVGFLTGRMLWLAMRKSWSRQPLLRTNYQGVTMPTAAGIVLSMSLLLIEAGRQLLSTFGVGDDVGMSGVRAGAMIAVLAFTVLGLLDDLVGTSGSRGFAGHAKALARGEVTSGMVKLIGGITASLVAAGLVLMDATDDGFGPLLLSAAVIALAANFFNLLDLRPGRSSKVGIFTFLVIALLSAFDTALVPAAIVIGAAAAILLDDLHEHLMMGDTGANALGAAVGFALATQLSGTGLLVAAVILLTLNLLSEVVSYTKLIDNFGPLKALDAIGRKRPAPTVDVRERGNSDADPFRGAGMGSAPMRTASAPAPASQAFNPD